MQSIWDSFVNAVSLWFPLVVAALAILLFGWIIALIARALTRRLLHWLKLDERLARGAESTRETPPVVEGAPPQAPSQAKVTQEKPLSVENAVAQFVYFLIIFMAFLGALNTLGMTQIAGLFNSMLNTIFVFLPLVIYALILAGIAWIVARFLRTLVTRALARVGVDKPIS